MNRYVKVFKALMCVIFFVVVAVAAFYVPWLADYCAVRFSEYGYLKIPAMIFIYISTLGLYAVILQIVKICNNVQRDNIFSLDNVRCFDKISTVALLETIYFVAGAVAVTAIGAMHPAVVLCFIVVIFMAVVLMSFSRLMSSLLKKAVDIKEENDYTI